MCFWFDPVGLHLKHLVYSAENMQFKQSFAMLNQFVKYYSETDTDDGERSLFLMPSS